MYIAREISIRAAEKEYCLVFPFYYAGQNFCVKPQPGTIVHSSEILYKLLDETCKEIARNGIKKIIICNGHGGNVDFLQFFCREQMDSPRDYAVFLFAPTVDEETDNKIKKMRKTTTGGHADEIESSMMLKIRPDLV